ncbi:hypothetical protein NA78x_006166 [Anatilimnocola sp. NA78]|uniref:hypothetical protein n=1 Tax=Anatilimnocola sp. NA78 TaxID=3415683 RepID=UPI003CE57D41
MVDRSIQSQLVACLDDLAVAQQRQVLEFALNLRAKPVVGVPGSALLVFAGTIDEGDLNLMSAAMEDGCERIDTDGW